MNSLDAILARLCMLFIGVAVFVVVLQLSSGNSYGASPGYSPDSPNVVTNDMAAAVGNFNEAIDSTGQQINDGEHSIATAATQSAVATKRAAIASVSFVGRMIWGGITLVGRITWGGISLVGRGIWGSVTFVGSTTGRIGGLINNTAVVNAVIRPANYGPSPEVIQLRAQQAAIIQKDTVSVAATNIGIGGACDNGSGNGGYPMSWCDASMDSIATIPYSGDTINRECTSYAYWYFTNVESHMDFHVSRDAKYWAATSNYPTHTTPAVGAIAVETAGAYGHVAIVQALPGQTYDGQVVPAGHLLVSEMNYDWNGHFRYSYSPLGKFSAYIYR